MFVAWGQQTQVLCQNAYLCLIKSNHLRTVPTDHVSGLPLSDYVTESLGGPFFQLRRAQLLPLLPCCYRKHMFWLTDRTQEDTPITRYLWTSVMEWSESFQNLPTVATDRVIHTFIHPLVHDQAWWYFSCLSPQQYFRFLLGNPPVKASLRLKIFFPRVTRPRILNSIQNTMMCAISIITYISSYRRKDTRKVKLYVESKVLPCSILGCHSEGLSTTVILGSSVVW